MRASGNRMGDVSSAIQRVAEGAGLSVVRSLVGHGVGRSMHEDPQVPNYGKPGKGPLLEEGMVLAIEPMTTAGRPAVRVAGDGWAIFSQDGSPAAHFEFTVAITGEGPKILTPWHLAPEDRTAEPVPQGAAAQAEGPEGWVGLMSWSCYHPESCSNARRFVRVRASPRPGSGGHDGSQSRVAGTQPPKGIMKVRPSVKPMCEKCKIIRRHGAVLVICQNKRHKQRQGYRLAWQESPGSTYP